MTALEEAVEKAQLIGYPLVVRPSYVLGGRAMEIVYDEVRSIVICRYRFWVTVHHNGFVAVFT